MSEDVTAQHVSSRVRASQCCLRALRNKDKNPVVRTWPPELECLALNTMPLPQKESDVISLIFRFLSIENDSHGTKCFISMFITKCGM